MTREWVKRKASPVHRISLTHGREGVPKFMRENSEQFFAAATRRKSKIVSASKPIIANEIPQSYQPKVKVNNEKKNENIRLTIPIAKKAPSPKIVLPPIRTVSSQRPKSASSADICLRQPALPPIISSPISSLEFSTPVIKSPTLLVRPKRRVRHGGPVDPDIFRNAYERALSVARSRLLFRDPYSLTRASATHGVLYSYYDHTPMCIFSRGTDCNHRPDQTTRSDRKNKANVLRKRIFNDVIVEHYIQ